MSKAIDNAISSFVESHKQDLLTSISKTDIYFATLVAQCCQESGFGSPVNSRGLPSICKLYNNFLGIRDFGSLNGIGQTGKTNDSNHYAIFNSPLSCFQTWVNAIMYGTGKVYINNGLLKAADPVSQIRVIADSGYCGLPPNPNDYFKPVSYLAKRCMSIYTIGKVA